MVSIEAFQNSPSCRRLLSFSDMTHRSGRSLESKKQSTHRRAPGAMIVSHLVATSISIAMSVWNPDLELPNSAVTSLVWNVALKWLCMVVAHHHLTYQQVLPQDNRFANEGMTLISCITLLSPTVKSTVAIAVIACCPCSAVNTVPVASMLLHLFGTSSSDMQDMVAPESSNAVTHLPYKFAAKANFDLALVVTNASSTFLACL